MTQIGGLLDSKGYGIATPKGSPWRDQLSLAILELQEKGTIQMLYNKWWKNTGDVCTRQVSKVIIHTVWSVNDGLSIYQKPAGNLPETCWKPAGNLPITYFFGF